MAGDPRDCTADEMREAIMLGRRIELAPGKHGYIYKGVLYTEELPPAFVTRFLSDGDEYGTD